MIIEAGGAGSLLILRLSIAGERYEANALQLSGRAQLLGELVAGHLGKTDVEQRYIRLEGFDASESVFPTICHLCLVTPGGEEHGEAVRRISIVVHDQYAAAFGLVWCALGGRGRRPNDPRQPDLERRAQSNAGAPSCAGAGCLDKVSPPVHGI